MTVELKEIKVRLMMDVENERTVLQTDLQNYGLDEANLFAEKLDYKAEGLCQDSIEAFMISGSIPNRSSPKWVSFVRAKTDCANKNDKAFAIIFIKIDVGQNKHRIFVISFGQGHQLLIRTKFVKNFGIIVALNSIDENSIMNTKTSMPQSNPRTTEQNIARPSSLFAFQINKVREILKGITGRSLDGFESGSKLRGSDILHIIRQNPFELNELPKLCLKAFQQYDGNFSYKKKGFEWIDNFIPVLAAKTTRSLNGQMKQAFEQAMEGNIPPELKLLCPSSAETNLFFLQKVNYIGEGIETLDDYHDISMNSYIEVLHYNKIIKHLPKYLENHKVVAYFSNGEREEWTVEECLIFQAKIKNIEYLFYERSWLQLTISMEGDLYSDMRKAYEKALKNWERISQNYNLRLPDAHGNEEEPKYCERIGFYDEFLSMDGTNVSGVTNLEPNDIMTKHGHLIFIKRNYGGEALCYLFSQGDNALHLLVEDYDFRKNYIELVERREKAFKNSQNQFSHYLPRPGEDYRPNSLTAVYGIIQEFTKTGPQQYERILKKNELSFPQLKNFYKSYQILRSYKVKVALAWIHRRIESMLNRLWDLKNKNF